MMMQIKKKEKIKNMETAIERINRIMTLKSSRMDFIPKKTVIRILKEIEYANDS